MQLEKLIIRNNYRTIREIPFKQGLNLVIDETSNNATDTGNSVGKTTFLRVIDYCLGSNGKDIYMEQEFKKTNKKVYEELVRDGYIFELTLSNAKRKIIIERSFSVSWAGKINGEVFQKQNAFNDELKKLLFSYTYRRPTLRELMPKFIRKDSHNMSNTVKYLHQTTTSDTYNFIYLLLFGHLDIVLVNEEFTIKKSLDQLQKRRKNILNGSSLSGIVQIIKVLDNDIQVEENKIKKMSIPEAYDQQMKELKTIRETIPKLSVELNDLEYRIKLSKKSIEELLSSKSLVDPKVLENIYSEAKRFIPNLQVKYENLYEFHNKMVGNKANFIQSQLDTYIRLYHYKEKLLHKRLKEEQEILVLLNDNNSFNDIIVLNKKVNKLYQQKGEQEALKQLILELDKKISEHEIKLLEIKYKLSVYKEDFDNKVALFNQFFISYSRELYDESFIFSYDPLDVDSIPATMGKGKKKGQVAAFDLAYITYLNEITLNYPKFVMHDSLEDISINQIHTLFDLANTIKGQYVVSILKEKLKFLGEDFIERNRILSLSKNEKLFRID